MLGRKRTREEQKGAECIENQGKRNVREKEAVDLHNVDDDEEEEAGSE